MKIVIRIVAKIGIFLLNVVYLFHKLFPTRNKVCVISRQHNKLSLDMRLVFDYLEEHHPEVECQQLCQKIPKGPKGMIRYFFRMIGPEMHALATSRVVLLEGYVIPVSILSHKKDLMVIQMWHALGILKNFARLAIGSEEGRSEFIAEVLRMHKNYDTVLTSSEFARPYFAKAFGYPEEDVTVLPLPRVDFLRDEQAISDLREKVLADYPELANGKKNILYAPTFRKDREDSTGVQALISAMDFQKYNLVIKLHPVDTTKVEDERVIIGKGYESMELFSVCDYVISDYSALIYDAAAAKKNIYLYTYDLEEYLTTRGFAIDFMEDIPLAKYRTAEEVLQAIQNQEGQKDMESFCRKFIAPIPNCTQQLVTLMGESLQLSSQENIEN